MGSRRGRRSAHVLRTLRAAAPRPGIRRHRGQRRHNILVYKDLGLVSQVFNEATLTTLHGDLAIGHTRYSTTGSSTWDNAQPVFKTDGVRSIALGHNGNLVNTHELAELAGRRGTATTDTDVVTAMLAEQMATNGLEDAALQLLPTLDGRVQLRVHGRTERVRGP